MLGLGWYRQSEGALGQDQGGEGGHSENLSLCGCSELLNWLITSQGKHTPINEVLKKKKNNQYECLFIITEKRRDIDFQNSGRVLLGCDMVKLSFLIFR